MQIHHPEASFRKDGEYAVTMNPGSDAPFAVIELSEDGNTFLFAPEADVDRLLSAAARAKAMFEALRRPHAYVRAIGGCAECGIDPGHHPEPEPVLEGTVAPRGEHPYPKPLVISDATIAQARYFEEHPWDEDEAEAVR